MAYMKLVLLAAGLVGGLAFFLPFRVEQGRDIVPMNALHEVEDDPGLCDAPLTRGINLINDDCLHDKIPHHRSYIPFYFLSAIVFLLIGIVALVRGRVGGFGALGGFAAALLALGGPLRELRAHDHNNSSLAIGAALLAISGALALVASVLVLGKHEPERPPKPPKKPPIDLPEARIVSRS